MDLDCGKYSVDADYAGRVSITHHDNHVMSTGGVHSLADGTEFVISPVVPEVMTLAADNANQLVAVINDNFYAASWNADNTIRFTVKSPVKAAISYITDEALSGIESVIANSSSGDVIYNLQGIRVSGKNLPSGFYIVNGRKSHIR